MIVKVCGMRDEINIKELGALGIDYMGLIFYEQSKRYVANQLNKKPAIPTVGVFVNEDFGFIQNKINQFYLQAVQLHGDETHTYCGELRDLLPKDIQLFKAFRVDKYLSSEQISKYNSFIDLFILDSAGKSYGGNGVKWDYELLDKLNISKPFLLSGGIDDGVPIEELVSIHPMCVGVDLNSKFETSPGLKNIDKLRRFIKS